MFPISNIDSTGIRGPQYHIEVINFLKRHLTIHQSFYNFCYILGYYLPVSSSNNAGVILPFDFYKRKSITVKFIFLMFTYIKFVYHTIYFCEIYILL